MPIIGMTSTLSPTKGEIREFSTFSFSLHIMFDQNMKSFNSLSDDLITKYIQKLHKRASMLQWILGRFAFI